MWETVGIFIIYILSALIMGLGIGIFMIGAKTLWSIL